MLESESNPGFFQTVAERLAALANLNSSGQNCSDNGPIEVNLLTLEDRVLYSAVPVPVDLVVQADAIDDAIESTFPAMSQPADPLLGLMEPESNSFADEISFESNSSEFDLAELDFNEDPSLDDGTEQDDQLLAPETDSSITTHELVVVDRGVEGHEQLVDDLLASQGGNRSFEIIYLDPATSGIESLTRQLSDRVAQGQEPYDALHLITHGTDGTINLGSDRLDSSNLDQFSESVADWGAALAIDADLLIYGCDVALACIAHWC